MSVLLFLVQPALSIRVQSDWQDIEFDDIDPNVLEYLEEYIYDYTKLESLNLTRAQAKILNGVQYRFEFEMDDAVLELVVWVKLDGSINVISRAARVSDDVLAENQGMNDPEPAQQPAASPQQQQYQQMLQQQRQQQQRQPQPKQ